MWTLSISMTFLVEPSSRASRRTWSSWMRTVLSTMLEFALAIRSAKKRCHSALENRMPLSASSWRRRLATSWPSVVMGR
ncbi:MAG: hypothetical protein BWY91_02757 [bacterium ADurb.BinA028]|nr:MAG: hypothetical protein BWY91_02757 [bacterium ADurb.BinA028]